MLGGSKKSYMGTKKTSVQLTWREEEESVGLRNTYGLRQILSAGLRLFLQLDSAEREKLVGEIMEVEEKNSHKWAERRAAQALWDDLPESARRMALAAVQAGKSITPKALRDALRSRPASKLPPAEDVVAYAESRRKDRKRKKRPAG